MYMLRCIDETWIKAVEESLPALDELIRNPSHFIAETEEILPIEMTKNYEQIRSALKPSYRSDF